MDIIKSIEHEQMKNTIPDLRVGNTVKVHIRVKEGNRERIQVFEGTIIKKQGGGVNQTFTVRRISYGVGVEKTFLIHSPSVEKIEVTRVGKARRAKLFYLRDRVGKAAKTKEIVGARLAHNEISIKEEEKEIEASEAAIEQTTEEIVNEPVAEVAPVVEKAENVKNETTKKAEPKVEDTKKAESKVENAKVVEPKKETKTK